MSETVIRGTAWTFGDDINSESIKPTGTDLDPKASIPHVLEYYDPEFPKKVKPNDFIVAGRNFGTSSSRPAGVVLKLIGLGAVICESSSRIFYRNTWSIGVPVLQCPGIRAKVNRGDQLEVDIATGRITNLTTGETMMAEPSIPLLLERWKVGGLLNWVKLHKEEYPTLK